MKWCIQLAIFPVLLEKPVYKCRVVAGRPQFKVTELLLSLIVKIIMLFIFSKQQTKKQQSSRRVAFAFHNYVHSLLQS